MKKTAAFIIQNKDLFARCMNKRGGMVKAIRDDPQIEKRCPACNAVLTLATIYEKRDGISREDTSLYCLKCGKEGTE